MYQNTEVHNVQLLEKGASLAKPYPPRIKIQGISEAQFKVQILL